MRLKRFFGSITWNFGSPTSECEADYIIRAKDMQEAKSKLIGKVNEMKSSGQYVDVKIRDIKPFACLNNL